MNDKRMQLNFAAGIVAVGLIVAAIIYTGGFIGSGGTASVSRPGYKEFNITMQNNRYNPSVVTANVGDRVVINFTNRDNVSHGMALPEFGSTVPNGHIPANGTARMEFVASRKTSSDAAVCGGPNPTDKTDDHGEELMARLS